jgi:hypothetical protein
MDGITIAKHPEDWSLTPNLLDYEATSAAFTWEAARKELDGAQGRPARRPKAPRPGSPRP